MIKLNFEKVEVNKINFILRTSKMIFDCVTGAGPQVTGPRPELAMIEVAEGFDDG